ncbi:hypothetical protein GAYE_SCF55G6297 [Galdieria yellowstonensis]|uniref:Uncharacterized protein n=1 Tax=Galdieria yellowstonensis TaxID=3028027 RepID=A0AAV9ILT5_9RHOD|nr:hypothetical protein GAYE_SCF55G6297 [Galdieria yellowstonensis]
MGIPKFYRWLSERFPVINQELEAEYEFDNFYLDMNGIIHLCTHNNNSVQLVWDNVEEMFDSIFEYTDRLYRIVKPKKLLFLAVDGVAPRAKMNQQRSRRFRSAKDAEKALAEAIARGEEIKSSSRFDSNCITPGTEFMHVLSQRFKDWISYMTTHDPAWQQGCDIIFSGPDVPGEGEHKVMDFIRTHAQDKEWAQRKHCLYGLDADLIMLGLVTHFPHFSLLREKYVIRKKDGEANKPKFFFEEFHFLQLALLRDMLYLEFKPLGDVKLPFDYELERVVDDFVFMCIFVGNDFLPNLPHLDINTGALNVMFAVYKSLLPQMGGYLTERHRIHPQRTECFLQQVAKAERAYFQYRAMEENEPGFLGDDYRKYYYESKLGIRVEEEPHRVRELCQKYYEGLHFILQYYYQGCPSWKWFYPSFYAPLASDMTQLEEWNVVFEQGHPFRPLTQLLAVLPPESCSFLPEPFRNLMISDISPLNEYYPPDFEVDLNGKRNSWEAIVLIPFIDENRLLNALATIDMNTELTDEERCRNEEGKNFIWHTRPRWKRKNRVTNRMRSAASRFENKSVDEQH